MSDTDRPGGADDAYLTLAFYIVVDVSYSMRESGAIDDANQILPEVIQAVTAEPTVADVVRVGLIDFSDDARVLLRLDDLRNVTNIPHLTERGGTSYAAAFQTLRQEMESDLKTLKADNFKIYRPAVFFITDGQPTDNAALLQQAFAELTDPSFRYRPNIIPFGVGTATKADVEKWVFPNAGEKKMRSYVYKDGAAPGKAIQEIAHILVSSILASAGSVNTAGSAGGFIPPDDEDLDGDWI